MKKVKYISCIIIIILFSSCNNNKSIVNELNSNPFTTDISSNFEQMAVYGISMKGIDSINSELVYNGKPINIVLEIQNGEYDCEVGLMIFIDGIIQPFSYNKSPENVTLSKHNVKGNENKDVSIQFTPVINNVGRNLKINFVSMFNPSFTPSELDMSYKNSHKISQLSPYRLSVKNSSENFEDANISSEYMTRSITDEIVKKNTIVDKTNNKIINRLEYMTSIVITNAKQNKSLDYINLDDKNDTEFELAIYGGPSIKYRLSMYINHEQVELLNGKSYLDVFVDKDTVKYVTFTLDSNQYKFDKYNNLYVIAVPLNDDYSEAALPILKSNTVAVVS